jgi:CDP-glucose 4,6-dehydratase
VIQLKNREILDELGGPVLITGHTGFKGAWLTLLLESQGIEVVGYALHPEKNSLYTQLNREGKIQELIGDIRDLIELRRFVNEVKPRYIVHLAAQPLVRKGYDEPLLTFETNAIGTANVLDVGKRTDSVQAIAAITTDKVYRNDNSNRSFTENDPLGGHDPYSASKVASEAAIMAWRSINSGDVEKPIYSLRAGNVIGGGDLNADRLLPDIIRSFQMNNTLLIRNPEATRPWQHVLDPLVGYLRALVMSPRSRDFNFGPSDSSLTVKEVVKIAQLSDKIKFNFEVQQQQNEKKMEAQKLELNASAARKELGWVENWSQEQSVTATIAWWESVLLKESSPIEACIRDIATLLEQ